MQVRATRLKLLAMAAIAIILLVSAFLLPIQAADKKERITIQRVDLHFVVDGQVYHTTKEQQGFIYNGRTYVPVRFASHVLEKWVSWNQSTATVSVLEPTDNQLKQLKTLKQQYLMPKADPTKPASGYTQQSIVASKDAANYVFFGKAQVTPKDTTTFLYEGTVYVPIRFFSDMIQLDVRYDGTAKSITMTTKNKEPDQSETKPGENGDKDGDKGNATEGQPGELPGVDANKPSRESIIAETSSAFNKLEASCTSQANSLFASYSKATDSEEKDKYLSQGFALLDSCEGQVGETIGSMETKLANYGYELGEEGNNFRDTYNDKKAAMIVQFTS